MKRSWQDSSVSAATLITCCRVGSAGTTPFVFFVTYEELYENKADVVLRLAEFLGEDYRKSLVDGKEFYENVLRKSSFSFMQELMKSNTTEMIKVYNAKLVLEGALQNLSQDSVIIQEEANLVRKGSVGGWKPYFSNENMGRMQSVLDEKFGINDIWKTV